MDWAKTLAPITAAVALIAVLAFFNFIQPQLQIAQAKEIARNDPYVQALVEEYKLEIAEIKLGDGEAFVLLTPPVAEIYKRDGQSTPDAWRIFRWALPFFPEPPAPTDEGELSAPSPVLPAGYILKVDLLEKKVDELGKMDEVTAIKDINLEDINFIKLEPAEAVAPEDPDLE